MKKTDAIHTEIRKTGWNTALRPAVEDKGPSPLLPSIRIAQEKVTEEQSERNLERLEAFEDELEALCHKFFGIDWEYSSRNEFAEKGIFVLRFFEGTLKKEVTS